MYPEGSYGRGVHGCEVSPTKACPRKELHIGNVSKTLVESSQLVEDPFPKDRGVWHEAKEHRSEQSW